MAVRGFADARHKMKVRVAGSDEPDTSEGDFGLFGQPFDHQFQDRLD
jgi:hypothetical protein